VPGWSLGGVSEELDSVPVSPCRQQYPYPSMARNLIDGLCTPCMQHALPLVQNN